MAIDYRYERGTVGNWKGYQVYILEKKEYIDNQHNLKNDIVYVIADDGMCMVNRGYIIGYLSRNGSINECDMVRYCPVPQVEENLIVTSASGEKFTNIPDGYFDKFTGEVTEFFKHLHDPIVVE